MRWMNLEPIIQSEVRQKEKDKYRIPVHISEKAMATHSSILAWRIPWTEEPVRLQSVGLQIVKNYWVTFYFISIIYIGEGNGNPLQYSCLENPVDGGAW